MTMNQLYVGNFPYDATEDELKEVMSRVGPTSSVRIVYDKETRHSKGYGFVEYRDPELCKAALDNLQGVHVRGRPLRLDWKSDEQRRTLGLGDNQDSRTASRRPGPSPSRVGGVDTAGGRGGGWDVQGTTAPAAAPGQSIYDEEGSLVGEVAEIMQKMSTAQLFYILGHMQKLVIQAPDVARALLLDNPQLCYALLHAQFITGMIDEKFLPLTKDQLDRARQVQERKKAELEQAGVFVPVMTAPAAAAAMLGAANPAQLARDVVAAAAAAAAPRYRSPQPAPVSVPAGLGGLPAAAAAAAAGGAAAAPSAATTGVGGIPAALQDFPGGITEVLNKLKNLTPQELESLSPEDRSRLLNLRQQLLAGAG